MASRRKSSTGGAHEARSVEVMMKLRVEELEVEVARLKERLDQLRKAKNTTILKREREVINVQAPNLNRRDGKLTDTKQIELEGKVSESNEKVAELEKEIRRMQDKHKDELFELSRKTLEDVNVKNNDKAPSCGHDQELEMLKFQISELKGDKAALRIENEELVSRIQEMYEEMSVKEADWCQKEELYKKKMSTGWQEKYQQWMDATEAKVNELQAANAYLRTIIKKPAGQDPTGQDDK